MVTGSYWDRLAIQSSIGDLFDEQRRRAIAVIKDLCQDGKCSGSVDAWAEANKDTLHRYDRFIDDLKSGEALDIFEVGWWHCGISWGLH